MSFVETWGEIDILGAQMRLLMGFYVTFSFGERMRKVDGSAAGCARRTDIRSSGNLK